MCERKESDSRKVPYCKVGGYEVDDAHQKFRKFMLWWWGLTLCGGMQAKVDSL